MHASSQGVIKLPKAAVHMLPRSVSLGPVVLYVCRNENLTSAELPVKSRPVLSAGLPVHYNLPPSYGKYIAASRGKNFIYKMGIRERHKQRMFTTRRARDNFAGRQNWTYLAYARRVRGRDAPNHNFAGRQNWTHPACAAGYPQRGSLSAREGASRTEGTEKGADAAPWPRTNTSGVGSNPAGEKENIGTGKKSAPWPPWGAGRLSVSAQ